jgi:hypothetical protein
VREQELKEREDKVLLHRPRQAQAEPAPAATTQAQAVGETSAVTIKRLLNQSGEEPS